VLHVFDEVCNLIDANSEVMSLVTPQIGDGPFSLVVPQVRFPDHAAPADQVVCDQNTLTIGGLEVDTSSAPVWNPRPPWGALRESPHRLQRHIPLLADVLRESALPGGLAGLVVELPEPTSTVEAEVLQAARAPADKLVKGLLQGDRGLSLEGVAGLAGLGGGLTPAGDDWLMGCVLATWAGLPKPGAETMALPIANAAARRTTVLSASWLRAAARGECNALWHPLFEGVLKEAESTVCEAARRIARQGHTSGADALAGFVALLTASRREVKYVMIS
jgi:hypothetical protein